jgi:hypothetical protein
MSEFSDAVETFVRSYFAGEVHTMQPGEITKVVSLNPPIVNVQPGFMRLREGAAEAEKRPVIPNVPFVFPVFGDFGVTGAIKVGMTVSLIAAERSIKTWVEQGGTVDPGIDSSFDLADCIAIPGLPNKTVNWDVPDDGIQIGTIDGASVVKVTTGQVDIKTPDLTATLTDVLTVGGGADFVALAQKVDDKIEALATAILTAVPVPQDGGAGLQAAAQIILDATPAYNQSVASTKTKTD